MKITPVKNYKIPLYAVGMTAVMLATAATGCKDPRRIRRDVPDKTDPTTTTSIVELDGVIDVADPTDEPLQIAGGETIDDPTEDPVQLDGEVPYTDPTDVAPSTAPATTYGDKASAK